MDDADNQPQPKENFDIGQNEPTPPSPETPPPENQSQSSAPTPSQPPEPSNTPLTEEESAAQQTPPSETQTETTPSPAPEWPAPQYKKSFSLSEIPHLRIIIAVIGLLIVAGLGYHFYPQICKIICTTTTTSSSTTTVPKINVKNIINCTVISKPGTYFLANNINTSIPSGACIKIIANNVKLEGNHNSVTGSGPFGSLPPFSYGILLQNVTNVTVTALRVSMFSYDVYLNNTKQSTISQSNLTSGSLASIYLYNSDNNTLKQNIISNSQGTQGGMYLQSGSGNKIANNTIENNAFYGLVINSTQNHLSLNNFRNNPADLVCNATSAFKYTNTFNSSSCSINDFCEFATCKKNIPFNISSIHLYPGPISTCGSIFSPGNYMLAQNLSSGTYINFSNPLAKQIPCIKVLSPDVHLDCQNKKISNSGAGVYLYSTVNANVSRCVFVNDTYGLFLNSSFSYRVSNITSTNSGYGIYVNNATDGKISDLTLNNNTYGIFLSQSSSVILVNTNAHKNSYGFYLDSGDSDVLNGGNLFNNTKADLYCTPSTYSSSADLSQNLACGVTDCNWASCKQKTLPNLKFHPINACQNIVFPGNYTVTYNILAAGDCFNIKTNNVSIDCGGRLISGPVSNTAFSAIGRTNLSITNCVIDHFNTAVNISNSKIIGLHHLQINNTNQGVAFFNVSKSNVTNVNVTDASVGGFYFQKVNSSRINNDSEARGSLNANGYIFVNSTRDDISFNNATSNPGYGFQFIDSKNNNIYNNTAVSNMLDYYCSPSVSGLYAENGGVNFGLSKNVCHWLVEISSLLPPPGCSAITFSSQINFDRDMLYTSGALGSSCFVLYDTTTPSGPSQADGSVIDCKGHTILATQGGTFVKIVNATKIKVQNCLIKNFTTGISTSGMGSMIFNNTIVDSSTGISTSSGPGYQIISQNLLENDTNGIIASLSPYINIIGNKVYQTHNDILVSGVADGIVQNNTVVGGLIGMSLTNLTLSNIKSNLLQQNNTSVGLECFGAAINKSSGNIDLGQNVCSSNVNCKWMTASPMCTPK